MIVTVPVYHVVFTTGGPDETSVSVEMPDPHPTTAETKSAERAASELLGERVYLFSVSDLSRVEDDVEAAGVTPDGNYLDDLRSAIGYLRRANDALVTIVGGGIADHDSQVGHLSIECGDEIGHMIERLEAADDDADLRVASLLRGKRTS